MLYWTIYRQEFHMTLFRVDLPDTRVYESPIF
jgi:hypothetical protein